MSLFWEGFWTGFLVAPCCLAFMLVLAGHVAEWILGIDERAERESNRRVGR